MPICTRSMRSKGKASPEKQQPPPTGNSSTSTTAAGRQLRGRGAPPPTAPPQEEEPSLPPPPPPTKTSSRSRATAQSAAPTSPTPSTASSTKSSTTTSRRNQAKSKVKRGKTQQMRNAGRQPTLFDDDTSSEEDMPMPPPPIPPYTASNKRKKVTNVILPTPTITSSLRARVGVLPDLEEEEEKVVSPAETEKISKSSGSNKPKQDAKKMTPLPLQPKVDLKPNIVKEEGRKLRPRGEDKKAKPFLPSELDGIVPGAFAAQCRLVSRELTVGLSAFVPAIERFDAKCVDLLSNLTSSIAEAQVKKVSTPQKTSAKKNSIPQTTSAKKSSTPQTTSAKKKSILKKNSIPKKTATPKNAENRSLDLVTDSDEEIVPDSSNRKKTSIVKNNNATILLDFDDEASTEEELFTDDPTPKKTSTVKNPNGAMSLDEASTEEELFQDSMNKKTSVKNSNGKITYDFVASDEELFPDSIHQKSSTTTVPDSSGKITFDFVAAAAEEESVPVQPSKKFILDSTYVVEERVPVVPTLVVPTPEVQNSANKMDTSSSSSSSTSSFKSALSHETAPSLPPHPKSNKGTSSSSSTSSKTLDTMMKKAEDAQRNKEETLKRKQELQKKKNEEWKLKAEKIKQQQEQSKKTQKPPLPGSIFTLPSKAGLPNFQSHVSSALKPAKAAGGIFSAIMNAPMFKASGPMKGFVKQPPTTDTFNKPLAPPLTSYADMKTPITAFNASNDVFKTPHDMSISFLDVTSDGGLNSYDITRYEDLDEELKHRENKPVPDWANNKQELAIMLFKQVHCKEIPGANFPFPKVPINYRMFPNYKERDSRH